MEPQDSKNIGALALKIATITSAIGKIKPEGFNTHSKYGFIGYEQLNAILRDLLLTHKVMLIPSFNTIEEQHIPAGNKTVTRTSVSGSVRIIDCETGAHIEAQMVGADQDYGGKSSGQAETEAYKRFLMKLFLVSTKDDMDADSRTVTIGTGQNPISEDQVMNLESMISKTGADKGKFLKYMKVASLQHITQERYSVAIASLEKKGGKR